MNFVTVQRHIFTNRPGYKGLQLPHVAPAGNTKNLASHIARQVKQLVPCVAIQRAEQLRAVILNRRDLRV